MRRRDRTRAGAIGEDTIQFVFAGGGTGGHVVPALAVAGELRRRGHAALFIGTRRGLEATLVPHAGFEIQWIEIGGLNRVGLKRALRSLWQLPASVLRSRALLRERAAAAVFSMGGYVAAPVMLAAAWRGTPLVVMEPNALPGLVARRMARRVSRALVAFEETQRYFPAGRSEVTGVPVRPEFFAIEPRDEDAPFTVLLTGGSQGSHALNQAAAACWPLLRRAGVEVRWVHQSGAREAEALRVSFAAAGLAGEVAPFIENMAAAYAQADLIVSRAGAGAVAEIAAAGRASILIPLPTAADDHQRHNAEALERAGAAVLLAERDLDGERLCAAVTELARDRGRRSAMGERARALAKPGAAQRAADVMEELAARVDTPQRRSEQ